MPALESPVRAAHRRGQPGSVLEGWCDPFPGYYLYHPSQRQPSPTFSVVVEALALGRLGRTWQPKQQAHEGGPRCNESSPPWSATATLLMCRGSILRQAASLARRRASRNVRPRSPGKRQGEPPLGADVPRTGTGLGGGTKKGPEGPFSMIYRLHWNSIDLYLERETRLELATPTLARSCSTN